MILYHFTSAHHIAKIRSQGLTKGVLPWAFDLKTGNPIMRRPFQWLTANPQWEQPWCLLGNLPFSRNAWRITVNIPAEHYPKIIEWLAICRRYNPESAAELNATGGDVENWRLFFGRIPPGWFLEVTRNGGQVMRPEDLLIGGG